MERNKKKKALPLVVVMALLLAFSSPADAKGIGGYAGNHPLIIYDHDTINGGLVYDTVTDGSKYTSLWPTGPRYEHLRPVLYQNLTVSIPEGATVKMARLYNTYCWSCWEGDDYAACPPAQAKLTLTDTSTDDTWAITCTHDYTPANRDECPNPIDSTNCPSYPSGVTHYWDTKGRNYTSTMWDFPSGEFAWDVTDLVTHTGTYNASICDPRNRRRRADERFVTFGFVLLVVYEDPNSPGIEYWIAEGCDALMARSFETPENATSSTTFGGVSKVGIANLTTVLTCSQGGLLNPPDNMVYFNGEEIGPSTAEGDMHYGVNLFDVTSLFRPDENVVAFQDRGDCEYVHNAWLVVRIDTTPPANITNLSYLNGTTWINWTWTDPPDTDFNYTMVYVNGTWQKNTSNPFYNATGLASDTPYEIGTRTVDELGNINDTWVNGTARTLPIPPNIIINEIMYNPTETPEKDHEWVEIYNNDTIPIDITGWNFYEDGANHGLTLKQGSMTISSGGYAVIAENDTAFMEDYPGYTGTLIDSSWGALHNDGETIALKNGSTIIDSVNYTSYTPIQEGRSLEKDATGWYESKVEGGTPGKINSIYDTTPPAGITNLTNVTGNFWINWTWDNPSDSDFNYVMVYINGTFKENVSSPLNYYNDTYTPHATQTLSTHTVDTAGNINETWKNQNQTTTIPNNEPVLDSIGDKTVDEGQTLTIDANATDIDSDTLTYSFNRTDLFADFNCTTGIGSGIPSSGQAGTYYVDFGVSDEYGGIDNETIRIIVLDKTPPASITNLTNVTGNFWINWTWDNPSDSDFNCTMVYIDGAWETNVSKPLNYYNGTYTAHATRTISTHTVDTAGNINETWINQTTTIPNNEPVLDSIGDKPVDEGQTVTIDANATDLDGDLLTYSCNRTSDLFTDFNPATGFGSWTPAPGQAGTYHVNFGVSDGFGGIDNETIKIIVCDRTLPASITNLSYLNGTTWINWTWTNPSDSDFNYTMVYLNGTWQMNTSNPFYMATELIPNTLYEIGTRTVDKVGNVNATWVNGTANTLSATYYFSALNITADKTEKTTTPNVNATFVLIVKNTGNAADFFNLTYTNPDNACVGLSHDQIMLDPLVTATVLLNVTNATENRYRVNVTAASEGNESVVECINTTTIVDGTPPIINLTSRQPADDSIINHSIPTVSVNYRDAPSGINAGINVSSVIIGVNDINVTLQSNVTASSVSYTPIMDLAEGNHSASVTVSDNAKNTNVTNWMFRVDTTKPTFTIRLEPNFDTNLVNATVNVSEPLKNDAAPTIDVTLNGAPHANQTVNWEQINRTWKGNYSIIKSGRYIVNASGTDTAGCFSYAIAPSNVRHLQIPANETVTIESADISVDITTNATVNGSITVTKTDESDIPIESNKKAVGFAKIDASENITNVTNVTIKLYYTAEDIEGIDESCLAIYYYNGTAWDKLDSTSGEDASGKYLTATIGHLSEFGLMGIDNQGPTFSGETPTGVINDLNPIIAVNYADAVTGVNTSSLLMTLNGDVVNGTTGSYIVGPAGVIYQGVLAEGIHSVNVTLNDIAGNSNVTKWNFTVDMTTPRIPTPGGQTLEYRTTGNITWNITEANPDRYWVLKNGTEVASPSTYISGTDLVVPIDTTALGVLNYTLIANDTAGNSASDQVNVTIQDTTKPTVTDYSPTGTGIDITTTISVTFREPMNKTSVENAFSCAGTLGPFRWTNDNTSFSRSASLSYNTTYNVTITAVANDLAGNGLASDCNWSFTTKSKSAPLRRTGRRAAPAINMPIDPATGSVTSTTSLNTEKATLKIPAGTIIKDAAGNSLTTSITMLHTKTITERVGAIAAYDFGPGGTTFEPAIELTISYDPADRPAGISESDLVIGMYDGTTWISLDTTVDTATHTATAKVSHFTIFALFVEKTVLPPTPTPTPAPTIALPSATPTPAPVLILPLPTLFLVLIVTAVIVIVGIIIIVLRRK